MGLSHYWHRGTELPAEDFAAAVEDVRTAIFKIQVPLAGFDGTGQPILKADTVVFNGQPPVEPFEIHQTEFDRRGRTSHWSYCKTEGAPYDVAVRAALIIFKHHLREKLIVASDAKGEGWEPARRLCEEAVGYGGDFSPGANGDKAKA